MAKKMSSEHMKEYKNFSPKQLKGHMKQEKELVKEKVKAKVASKSMPIKAAKKTLKKCRGK